MDRREFELLVAETIEAMPDEFIARLENVTVIVQDHATPGQLAKARLRRGQTLLGLYEGVPLTKRGGHVSVVPDRIIIFQGPIESKCRDNTEIAAEIRRVVQHEIAHHFGISDVRLKELWK